MSDLFVTQLNLTEFFEEIGGAEAALTVRDTDPARFAALAAKHNIIIPTRIADLERAVITRVVEWREQMKNSDIGMFVGQQHYATFLELIEAVDALLREREGKQ